MNACRLLFVLLSWQLSWGAGEHQQRCGGRCEKHLHSPDSMPKGRVLPGALVMAAQLLKLPSCVLGCFCETTHATKVGTQATLLQSGSLRGGVLWGDLSDCGRLSTHTVHVLKFAHGVAMSVCALLVCAAVCAASAQGKVGCLLRFHATLSISHALPR